jgi:hypothetical protein
MSLILLDIIIKWDNIENIIIKWDNIEKVPEIFLEKRSQTATDKVKEICFRPFLKPKL